MDVVPHIMAVWPPQPPDSNSIPGLVKPIPKLLNSDRRVGGLRYKPIPYIIRYAPGTISSNSDCRECGSIHTIGYIVAGCR